MVVPISSVLSKRLYDFGAFWHIQALLLIGNFLAAALVVVVSKKVRTGMMGTELFAGGKVPWLFVARMVGETAGYVLFNLALLLGSAPLTAALDGLSGFYVFIAATIISLWLPALFREKLDRKTLLTKATAIVLIMAGLFLLAR